MTTTTTYGPNTALVERVIKQAQTMTPEQAGALGVARYAAWDATLDDAWNTAWYAAGDAARVADLDAAWDDALDVALAFAGNAARYAAKVAAAACVVRHLITPEHFDILTEPWFAVFGPIDANA